MTLGKQFDHLEGEPRMGSYELEQSKAVTKRMAERGFLVDQGTHGTAWYEGMSEVLPADEVGVTNFSSTSRVNRAYYTAHLSNNPKYAEDSGWSWARTAAENSVRYSPEPHAVNPDVTVPRRPVVHEVEAVGLIAGDPVLNPNGSAKELTADKLAIKDTHWVPRVSPWRLDVLGHQGTLPHVNWNRWGDPNRSQDDFNVKEIELPDKHKNMVNEWADSKPKTQRRQRKMPGQLSMDINSSEPEVTPVKQQSREDWVIEMMQKGHRW